MDRKAVFLEKLEKELAKIQLDSVEETEEDFRSGAPEEEDPETFLVEIPVLDHERTNESEAESSVLACRILNDAEGCGDIVVVSKVAGRSPSEVSDLERAIQPHVLDNEGKKSQKPVPRVEDLSKFPPSNVEDSTETHGPPAKVPKVSADSDAEERECDSELHTKDLRSPDTEKGDVEGEKDDDVCSDTEDEAEKEELMSLLLPGEKEELNVISETTKLHSKLIDTIKNYLYGKLRKEAEAHCLSIKQKAVDEISIFKRSSSVVVKEYQRATLMVMKYLETQLKRVNSYENSALKSVIDDFKKNERDVFERVRERKQSCLEEYRRKKKVSYVHNPFLFYITFVIVLTIYSAFAIRLINLSKL